MYLNHFGRMAIISREKLTGLGSHVGVLLPDGSVAHNTDTRGIHLVSADEFKAGKAVKIIRTVPVEEHNATYRRLRSEMASGRKYDAVQNNCEMFANRVTGLPEQSPQVLVWLAALALGVMVCAKAR